MPRGSSPSHDLQLHEVRRRQDELDAAARSPRANMSPRASSGSSAGGTDATKSEPRASATRCRSSTLAGGRRDGSRSSGSETRARATCDGDVDALGRDRCGSPSRAMSPSSSPCGSARRMSASRWAASGMREVGTGGRSTRLALYAEDSKGSLQASAAVATYAAPPAACRGERCRRQAASGRRSAARSPRQRAATYVAGRHGREPGDGGVDGADARFGAAELAAADGPREARERSATTPGAASSTATRSTSRGRSRREGLRGQGRPRLRRSAVRVAGGLRRTRRGSTARPTGASCGTRRTTTAGTATASARTSTCSRRGSRRSRDLLAPTGTLWVHVDWRASYLVRVAARRDPRARRVRERDRLAPRAEPRAAGGEPPVRADARHARRLRRGRGRRALVVPPTRLEPIEPAAVRMRRRRAPVHDGAARRLHRRVHRAARRRGARAPDARAGKVYVKYFLVKDADGVVVPRAARRRALDRRAAAPPRARRASAPGFPTQKPRALLDRIVACATPPGGPRGRRLRRERHDGRERARARAPRSSWATRRRWRIATARARLLRAGAALSVERCGGAAAREATAAAVARRARRARGRVRVDARGAARAAGLGHRRRVRRGRARSARRGTRSGARARRPRRRRARRSSSARAGAARACASGTTTGASPRRRRAARSA